MGVHKNLITATMNKAALFILGLLLLSLVIATVSASSEADQRRGFKKSLKKVKKGVKKIGKVVTGAFDFGSIKCKGCKLVLSKASGKLGDAGAVGSVLNGFCGSIPVGSSLCKKAFKPYISKIVNAYNNKEQNICKAVGLC